MWRREGEVVSYMYLPNKSTNCGKDWDWDTRVTAGGWNDVSMYIKLNDPGVPLQHCSLQSTES